MTVCSIQSNNYDTVHIQINPSEQETSELNALILYQLNNE